MWSRVLVWSKHQTVMATKNATPRILASTGKDYCENTTVHGFAYWVSSGKCSIRLYLAQNQYTIQCRKLCWTSFLGGCCHHWLHLCITHFEPDHNRLVTFTYKGTTTLKVLTVNHCLLFRSTSQVSINSFSVPITDLPFPAITICKTSDGDPGDYVRAVYNNFLFKCNDTTSCESRKLLGDHFTAYANNEFLQTVTCFSNQWMSWLSVPFV